MNPILRKFSLFGLLIFALPLWSISQSFAVADLGAISLEGTHRFRAGDDPRWSQLDLDDSQWTPIAVPGNWQSQDVEPLRCMGWYRIRFSAPQSTGLLQPALMLGRVGNVDEVFLNGVKIGSEGVFGDRFVDNPWGQRLYRIPPGLLRSGEVNLLAVRVMNTYRHGGILEAPVCIGELGNLLVMKYDREFARKVMEAGLLIFFVFTLLSSLFLYLVGVRESGYLAFAAFIFIWGLMFVPDSLIFYEAGLKTSFAQRTVHAANALIPAAGLFFLLSLYAMPIRLWNGSILISYGMLSLGFLISISFRIDYFLVQVWQCLALLTMGLCLFITVSAWFRKLHESGPVLVGVAGLFAFGFIEVVEAIRPRYFQSFAASEYGLVFFLVCIAYALMARYGRTRKELRLLSGRILDAHEEERKRLSREIHDGIGQPLLGIKLHLQMLDAKAGAGVSVEKEVFSSLISEVSHSIGELRQVAMDLRPALLEDATLAAAIKWHGDKFTEKSGICLRIETDEEADPSRRTKEHLYRIYQEALSNIGRHAAADRVDVRLARNGKLIFLEIEDNGKGFNPGRDGEKKSGLGLSTIKERVGLLGGIFTLKSNPGAGTTIHIEVPLK